MPGRTVSWNIELPEYDIYLVPRGNIKSHVFPDFLDELCTLTGEDTRYHCILSLDEALNLKGSDVGLVLEGLLSDLHIEQLV